MKLTDSFYQHHVVDVAQALLGKRLVYGPHQGIITETEAYRGSDDEASHAFRGMTQRSAIMFGPPGYAYVYIIYGLYYCLNIVAESAGQAGAVLIRGLKLPSLHLDGPGKICRHLGITKKDNGTYLVDNDQFYLTQGVPITRMLIQPRVGIRKAIDKPWRFIADLSDL
jgi:DNA-3-methyladenine glycosylase